jgi:hypothetical protein
MDSWVPDNSVASEAKGKLQLTTHEPRDPGIHETRSHHGFVFGFLASWLHGFLMDRLFLGPAAILLDSLRSME